MPDRAQSDAYALGISAVQPHGMEETKRAFLRRVSHELRTPLNAVIGFSEIIGRELHGPIGDKRYKEHADVIRDSGLKLLKLVNQVLEIVRLEAGAADLDIRPEAAVAAVEAAVQSVQAEASAKGLSIEVLDDPDLPLVLADARGLNAVLLNLLQNAVSFSPRGGVVRVRVRTGRDSVLFEVRDQGEGVPASEAHRLVRPFEQGENPLVRNTDGAGLGLSITSLLCREMGGHLVIHSAPGRGLAARVRLPSVPTATVLEMTRPAA